MPQWTGTHLWARSTRRSSKTQPGDPQMELESSHLDACLGLALASLAPRDRLRLKVRVEDGLSAAGFADGGGGAKMTRAAVL